MLSPYLITPAVLIGLPFLLTLSVNLAEASAVYLDDSELSAMAQNGDGKAARLERLLESHSRLRLSVDFITLFCLGISSYTASVSCVGFFTQKPHWGWSGSVPVQLLIMFLFCLLMFALGVVAPRRIAAYFPNTALALSLPLSACFFLLTPFTAAIDFLSAVAVRLFGRDPENSPKQVTEEEIRMLVDEGEERGAIENSEKEMINNIFEFDDRDVSQVMTHRTELTAIELSSSLNDVARLAIESGYSRIPVYENDIDSICGILYVKDLLHYISSPSSFHLCDVMRKPLYVPESGSCSDVFSLMQKQKVQMAVVVDEYGGTYGIVTMEDLLESIVGNIEDEYDDEQPQIIKVDEGVYLLDGSLGISDAERLLGLHLTDESDADTLGGFVTSLLGGVPRSPSAPRSAKFQNVTFTAVHCDDRRIDKIRAAVETGEDG